MDNSPQLGPSEASRPSPNSSENARLRKERREAKIRAGGSARLSKITGLGGSLKESEAHCTPSPRVEPEIIEKSNNDSKVFWGLGSPAAADQTGSNRVETADVRTNTVRVNELLGMGNVTASDDPMMKILQQMMGGIPGEGPSGTPSFQNTLNNTAAASTASHALFWRMAHAIFALSFGLYVSLTTQFTGSKIMRERSFLGYNSIDGELLNPNTSNIFYLFVALETVLLTTQYLLEKERVQPGGFTGMAMEFVPEKIKRYSQWGMRYFDIWMAISRDAMVFIFVLGAYAWLRGEHNT